MAEITGPMLGEKKKENERLVYIAAYPVNIKIYFSSNSQVLQQCY